MASLAFGTAVLLAVVGATTVEWREVPVRVQPPVRPLVERGVDWRVRPVLFKSADGYRVELRVTARNTTKHPVPIPCDAVTLTVQYSEQQANGELEWGGLSHDAPGLACRDDELAPLAKGATRRFTAHFPRDKHAEDELLVGGAVRLTVNVGEGAIGRLRVEIPATGRPRMAFEPADAP